MLADLEKEEALGFLRPALDLIASPTIRNMATVGGNLFVKQPYGDFAACLIALGATGTVSDGSTTRIEPVERLVASGVKAGEIVTQIAFAAACGGQFQIRKGRAQGAERCGHRNGRGVSSASRTERSPPAASRSAASPGMRCGRNRSRQPFSASRSTAPAWRRLRVRQRMTSIRSTTPMQAPGTGRA